MDTACGTLSILLRRDDGLEKLRAQYEAELGEWRARCEEAQAALASTKLELANIKQDNKQLNLKYAGRTLVLTGCNRQIAFRGENYSIYFSKFQTL